MATAADVPRIYDIVLNGEGYVFLDTITPSLPFRSHKATYKVSPTFIERSNVTGAFGDNQQDWWFTASQNDWSLGEEQKFFRLGDQVSRSRYWRGMNVDLSLPGQVMIGAGTQTVTFPSIVHSITYSPWTNNYIAVGQTDVFELDRTGTTVTARGAHGCGGVPTSVAFDANYFYLTGAACTSIRLYNPSAPSFSTFSASPAYSIVYANNSLYGTTVSTGGYGLSRWDTAGAVTSLFQWKTASGVTQGGDLWRFISYGAKVFILRFAQINLGPELWVYDGTSTYKVLEMEPNFVVHDFVSAEGVLFFTGLATKQGKSRFELRYYANGSTGLAYSSVWAAGVPAGKTSCAAFGTGVMFTDPVHGALMYYDLAAGSASSFAAFTGTAATAELAASDITAVIVASTVSSTTYFTSFTASSASLQTSLFDFESSLTKMIRAVKVDFNSDTVGDGGKVDLYYTTDDVTSTVNFLASNVTSGSEITLNQSCHAISIIAVLKKSTSTNGPTLKRIYVRAAPILQQFRQREYVIDCTGDAYEDTRELRDGTPMPVSGGSQAASLTTLAQQTTPFSITDRFGTFTGLVDLNDPEGFEIYEIHADPDVPGQSGNFIVRVKVREV